MFKTAAFRRCQTNCHIADDELHASRWHREIRPVATELQLKWRCNLSATIAYNGCRGFVATKLHRVMAPFGDSAKLLADLYKAIMSNMQNVRKSIEAYRMPL